MIAHIVFSNGKETTRHPKKNQIELLIQEVVRWRGVVLSVTLTDNGSKTIAVWERVGTSRQCMTLTRMTREYAELQAA